MERLLDIFFSSIAMIALLPLLCPIILILRLSGEGEIFFFKSGSAKMVKFFGCLNSRPCSKIVLI